MVRNLKVKKKPTESYLPLAADHSLLMKINKGSMKGLIARKSKERVGKDSLTLHTHTMALAHLLFPKNFPMPVAAKILKFVQSYSRSKKSVSTRKPTMYSKEVYLDSLSNKAIRDFYNVKNSDETSNESLHKERLPATILTDLNRVQEAGFQVNKHYANIGLRRNSKRPVFFEVKYLDIYKIQDYVRSLPEKTKARKLKRGLRLIF
ncbi:MAG: hypothetical protein ABIA76_04990 [Candidatus Diapherotrites archaeon]